MLFYNRKDSLHILRVGDGPFDFFKGQELLADDPAEAFSNLPLLFRENPL